MLLVDIWFCVFVSNSNYISDGHPIYTDHPRRRTTAFSSITSAVPWTIHVAHIPLDGEGASPWVLAPIGCSRDSWIVRAHLPRKAVYLGWFTTAMTASWHPRLIRVTIRTCCTSMQRAPPYPCSVSSRTAHNYRPVNTFSLTWCLGQWLV